MPPCRFLRSSCLAAGCASKNFFTKQTLTDIDRLSFKVLLPILLFRDIAQGRITEQFDPVFFFFCAGATTVYFFAVWIGASLFLKDKSMVWRVHTGRFPRLTGDSGRGLCAESVRKCRSCAADDRGECAAVQHLFGAGADCHRAGRTAGGPPRPGRQNAARHHHQPIILGIFAGLPFSLLAIDFRRCWTRVCPCWATAQRLWRC